jgi:hypothetical protein
MSEAEVKQIRATGGCLCGSVRYIVRGELRNVVACHCVFCRRLHSHFAAYAACDKADLELISVGKLRWYRSSPTTHRGFCSRCGAQIFSENRDEGDISIAAGTFNEPTGLTLIEHICVAQKGSYYEITDGLPQKRGGADCN